MSVPVEKRKYWLLTAKNALRASMPANPRQNGTVNKRQPTATTAITMTRAVGSVVASDMPTKAPIVTPAVTSKRYLRVIEPGLKSSFFFFLTKRLVE